MQVATACVLHRAASYGQSEGYSRNVALTLISFISIETIYHSYMDEHVVHELTFLFLILLVIYQTRSLIRKRVEKQKDKEMLRWLCIFGAGKLFHKHFETVLKYSDLTHSMLPLRLPSLEPRLHLLRPADCLEACDRHAMGFRS